QVHPKGHLVALHAAGSTPVVRVLDIDTGAIEAELPGAGPVPAAPGLEYQTTVRFSPDGAWLATVREGKAIHLWDVATWKESGTMDGDTSILDFSADGRTLFRGYVWNGAAETLVRVNDTKSRTQKASIHLPIAGELAWSDLSPDGRTVAYRARSANSIALF